MAALVGCTGHCETGDRGRMALGRLSPVVDTENPVRIENARFRPVREIIIVSKMSPFFIALLALVSSTFRARAALQAEIVALRHQIAVLQQSAPRRLHLRQSDFSGFCCLVSGRVGGTGCTSSSRTPSSAGIGGRLRTIGPGN